MRLSLTSRRYSDQAQQVVKSLDKGWVVESNFKLGQDGESGELRTKRFVLKLLQRPSRSFEHCANRAFPNSWAFFLRKQDESVTQWVETLVSGCAAILPDSTGHTFTRPGDQPFLLLLEWIPCQR